MERWLAVCGRRKRGLLEVEAPAMSVKEFSPTYHIVDEFKDSSLNRHFQTLRIPFTDQIGSVTENPHHLRLYGQESLTSKFTQAFVARRWQSFYFEAETAVSFFPKNFQQAAGLVNYYNTENWTALQVTYDEALGRILELSVCENLAFSQPLIKKSSSQTRFRMCI